MKLHELLKDFPQARWEENFSLEVNGISMDSRSVQTGDIFVAMKGEKEDGIRFIPEAIQRGAVAILSEVPLPKQKIPVIVLERIRSQIGSLSSKIYGSPSQRLRIIGITGTNGKTTTANLLESILQSCGRKPANIGTIGYRWNEKQEEASRTTPEAPVLHRMLATMEREGITDVVMECSSHGLALGRLKGLHMDVGVFTNLTRDHLDFHPTLQEYEQAKWKMFEEILAESSKSKRYAILNEDDPVGGKWKKRLSLPVFTFSVQPNSRADIHPVETFLSLDGIRAKVFVRAKTFALESPLVGLHNVSNLLAALAVSEVLELPKEKVLEGLQKVSQIPGRLERVTSSKKFHVFVDYAHTDDALQSILKALLPFRKRRLLVVFGCGGNRDRGKRPLMGKVVSEWADFFVVTSDNPRDENPESIVEEIVSGISKEISFLPASEIFSLTPKTACKILDRKEAIEKALTLCKEGDLLLIAGKGHETFQEIQGKKFLFDDREVVRQWFQKERV